MLTLGTGVHLSDWLGGRKMLTLFNRLFAVNLVTFTLLFVTASWAQSPPNVKLPSNITVEIQKPAADVPAGYAAFSGKWGGHWGGPLPSNLIVESVTTSGEARGVYAWSDHPTGAFKAGAFKFRAKIEDGILTWSQNVYKFEFKVLPDGKLQGERYNIGRRDAAVTMVKMQ